MTPDHLIEIALIEVSRWQRAAMSAALAATFAVGIAAPSTAEEDKSAEFYIGLAVIEYGWINCPVGTVSAERGSLANSVLMNLDREQLLEYRDKAKELLKTDADNDLACTVIAQQVAASQ